MKIKILAIILVIMVIPAAGCALFHSTKPGDTIITHPLGTDSVKIGMSKEQVKSIMGSPDAVVYKGTTKDILSSQLEEWTYKARYNEMPLKADYFGKTMILTFDGDNLTSYRSEK